MAFDTVRSNKMRSALTVLGVVIGITSIVGMTAMIRGFDQSLRDMIGAIGPNTIFVQRFGVTSFANGAEFSELLQAAEPDDLRRARARGAGRRRFSSSTSSSAPAVRRPSGASSTATQKTKPLVVFGTSEYFAEGTQDPDARRAASSTAPKCSTARTSSCSATPPYKLLFEPTGIDPIGKIVRVGSERFEVVGVFDKRPSAGGFNLGQDDFVVIPYTDVSARSSACASVRIGTQRHDPATIQICAAAARRRQRRRTRWPTSSASCASATA